MDGVHDGRWIEGGGGSGWGGNGRGLIGEWAVVAWRGCVGRKKEKDGRGDEGVCTEGVREGVESEWMCIQRIRMEGCGRERSMISRHEGRVGVQVRR